MLQTIVLILHTLVCLMIVGLVLLQRGKGAEAGTGFGAGASGTVFGARGSANFLSRTTALLATTFFVTSLALAYFSTEQQEPESILDRMAPAGGSRAVPSEPQDLDAPPELPAQLPADDAPTAEQPSPADEPEAPSTEAEGN